MTLELLVVVVGEDGSVPTATTTGALADDVANGACRMLVVDDLATLSPSLTSQPFVAFVLAGDRPSRSAIGSIVAALDERPDLDILYGDEDRVGIDGRRVDPFHKPAWSPERLWGHDLFGSMVTYRSSLVAAVLAGGDVEARLDRPGQMRELGLAVARRAGTVGHLPKVICHRAAAAESSESVVDVVQRHFDRLGLPARAVDVGCGVGGGTLTGFEPMLGADVPLVSIVIPTGGATRTVRGRSFVLVDNAVRSVAERTTHDPIEIVVVVDATSDDELGERIRAIDPRVTTVKDVRPFNFAAACNLGAAKSTGDVIVLLNDDTEVITPDWIERLIVLTSVDEVGAVGVKLFYGDGRIQHGGVATRDTGPDHLYHGYPGNDPGHGDWLRLTVNCFAATGACLAVRRDHWEAVGGMDEQFPLNYNDIDLCLRLAARGWRTVVDNRTELMHLETSSRPMGSETWEVEAFRQRWGVWLDNDPYDNPNLVTMGLLQVPPPPALTALAEFRGLAEHDVRVWTSAAGFEVAEQPAGPGPDSLPVIEGHPSQQ